jgi:hypothetical protein
MPRLNVLVAWRQLTRPGAARLVDFIPKKRSAPPGLRAVSPDWSVEA